MTGYDWSRRNFLEFGLNFVVDAGEALFQILPVDLLIVLHLLSMLLQFFLVDGTVSQNGIKA
jgi:hypothetical protein